VDKAQLIEDVRHALYASKICSYAQGMNIIKAKSSKKGWGLNLGELARIWKGGCIIRAIFLDRIKKAYGRNPDLVNLLVDPEFTQEIMDRQAAWRRVVCLAINNGVSTQACPLAWLTSTPTGGTSCLPTWCKRRGTTLRLTPMRGSTCPVPSTRSGSKSRGTPQTELLMLLSKKSMPWPDVIWSYIFIYLLRNIE
jgi:hypothetical protein